MPPPPPPPPPAPPTPPPQMRVVLQNVTASVSMRIVIDPSSVANKIRNAEYNPKKLPACVSAFEFVLPLLKSARA